MPGNHHLAVCRNPNELMAAPRGGVPHVEHGRFMSPMCKASPCREGGSPLRSFGPTIAIAHPGLLWSRGVDPSIPGLRVHVAGFNPIHSARPCAAPTTASDRHGHEHHHFGFVEHEFRICARPGLSPGAVVAIPRGPRHGTLGLSTLSRSPDTASTLS